MPYNAENMEVGQNSMAQLGVGQITYIRQTQNSAGFSVFAADGTKLADFPSYDAAFFTARQFNLVPVSVH